MFRPVNRKMFPFLFSSNEFALTIQLLIVLVDSFKNLEAWGYDQKLIDSVSEDLNLNSLRVTRQMTLFHQGVWMGEKLVHSMACFCRHD